MDFGGTKIEAAALDAEGRFLSRVRGTSPRNYEAGLIAVREQIADHFTGALTAQDRGVPRLHITVQNKVAPTEARVLLAELAQDFHPRPLAISGLAIHHYRGGPWETVSTRNFRGTRR